jgi:hypothetical protein
MLNIHPGSILSKQSVLVTFGSPRVLSVEDSKKLCNFAVKDKITLIHRYSNNSDPITSLPPNRGGFHYAHPCSSFHDKKKGNRKLVARDCESPTNVFKQLDYSIPINCIDKEPTVTKQLLNLGANPLSHASYLYVSFSHKSDLIRTLLGPTAYWTSEEIGRVSKTESKYHINKGDTELRIISMSGNNKLGIYFIYFVDLVNLRVITKENDLPEDLILTKKIFDDILKAPHSKITVKFEDNLPIPFPKQVKDSKILDVSYPNYQKDLQKTMLTNNKRITKKLNKKHNKTRKNK